MTNGVSTRSKWGHPRMVDTTSPNYRSDETGAARFLPAMELLLLMA
jgi:hypothetical protein